jgi:hypothetical protein
MDLRHTNAHRHSHEQGSRRVDFQDQIMKKEKKLAKDENKTTFASPS